MKDNSWRSEETQALDLLIEKYQMNVDFQFFVEFCQYKQKGLRKIALQKIEQFVEFWKSQSLEKQRKIACMLMQDFMTIKGYHFLLVSPLKIYLMLILEKWQQDEPNNADLYYWLGQMTNDRTYYFKGLEIDPTHLDCARQVIFTKLDFVDYQLHHVSESKFVYDYGNVEDGKEALQEVQELIEKYPELDDYVKSEYQETKQLFDDWLSFTDSDFDDFPTWCRANGRDYRFASIVYYKK